MLMNQGQNDAAIFRFASAGLFDLIIITSSTQIRVFGLSKYARAISTATYNNSYEVVEVATELTEKECVDQSWIAAPAPLAGSLIIGEGRMSLSPEDTLRTDSRVAANKFRVI
jgi:hypothetical protein